MNLKHPVLAVALSAGLSGLACADNTAVLDALQQDSSPNRPSIQHFQRDLVVR
ncbi:hypothetical protein [Burkholderia sp. IDO3]|uniref:hypothetical protein n=1 Tax=Burkholderia sp. IDO3 TaxID=1705310 RepID=UPI0013B47318|nr:hypothetical protein [Burkholderia sp. IDO3]